MQAKTMGMTGIIMIYCDKLFCIKTEFLRAFLRDINQPVL